MSRDQLTSLLTQLVDSIDAGRPDGEVTRVLADSVSRCARGPQTTTDRRLIEQLTQVLETWQQVWPRMGRQQVFRQAVAREASQWAKRLANDSPTGPHHAKQA